MKSFLSRKITSIRQVLAAAPRLSTLAPPIPGLQLSHDHQQGGEELVICIHGLWRSKFAMGEVVKDMRSEGYSTLNVAYPSYSATLEEMVQLLDGLILKYAENYQKIHFVTHSLGGVILRQLFNIRGLPKLGNVVMLAPPLRGSWIMDSLSESPLIKLFGPAGKFLSGSSMLEMPQDLPPRLMIIMGDRPKITFFKNVFGEVPNDGIVRVSSGRVEGGHEFLVMPIDHTLINSDPEVLKITKRFIVNGVIW